MGSSDAIWLSGEWQPIHVTLPGLDVNALPMRSPFAVGSFFLAQALAASLTTGKTVIPEAANFNDGLEVQRMLEFARVAHTEQRWVQL